MCVSEPLLQNDTTVRALIYSHRDSPFNSCIWSVYKHGGNLPHGARKVGRESCNGNCPRGARARTRHGERRRVDWQRGKDEQGRGRKVELQTRVSGCQASDKGCNGPVVCRRVGTAALTSVHAVPLSTYSRHLQSTGAFPRTVPVAVKSRTDAQRNPPVSLTAKGATEEP